MSKIQKNQNTVCIDLSKSELAPVCLFVYNRLDETRKTINFLKKNFLAIKTKLFIFSDGYKSKKDKKLVMSVRNYINKIEGFKSIDIFESNTNKGLAKSIIDGVSYVFNEHNKLIVLEDDLITTPNFLDYMNQALNFYKNNKSVMSINGFSLDVGVNSSNNTDVFFHSRTYSWGWGTWKSCWDEEYFDNRKIQNKLNIKTLNLFKKKCGNDISNMLIDCLEGKNSSWYVKWVFRHFVTNKYGLYPIFSKVQNIGYGEMATHCKTIDVLKTKHDKKYLREFVFSDKVYIDQKINYRFLNYFTFKHKLFFRIKLIFKKHGINLLLKDIQQKYIK